MKVTDRKGNLQEFDPNRIKTALYRAFKQCKIDINSTVIEEIYNSVYIWDKMSIEEIQDQIEELLMNYDYQQVAKEYILYRYKHKLARNIADSNKFNTTIEEIVSGKTNEVTTENGNKNPKQFNVMRDLVAGEVCKKLYKELECDPELLKLHDKGVIHIHDTDYRFMHGITNCFSRDTKFITSEGVISFNDVEDGTIVYVPTHTGKWKKAVVRNYGMQDIYEYTISTINRVGYGVKVKSTENHRWFLNSGVQTTELKVGDKLLTKNDLITNISFDSILNNKELVKYWCYGFILGDGSTIDKSYMYSHGLGKRKKSKNAKRLFETRIRLCGNKIKYLQYFLNAGMKQYPIKNSNDLLILDYTFNKKDFLENKDYTKLNKEQIIALIKGLICADGERKKYNPILDEEIPNGISSSNKEIQEIIERYSALAGYYISKITINNKDTNYGKRSAPLYEYKFVTQTPQRAVSKKGLEYFKIIPYKVLDKNYLGKESVWCLEVEDDHSFILANGLITGNCSLINLEDMLQNGTVVNGKLIEKPHSLRTATTVATQIITAVSSSQYGFPF